jgi:hypothetical protein
VKKKKKMADSLRVALNWETVTKCAKVKYVRASCGIMKKKVVVDDSKVDEMPCSFFDGFGRKVASASVS